MVLTVLIQLSRMFFIALPFRLVAEMGCIKGCHNFNFKSKIDRYKLSKINSRITDPVPIPVACSSTFPDIMATAGVGDDRETTPLENLVALTVALLFLLEKKRRLN